MSNDEVRPCGNCQKTECDYCTPVLGKAYYEVREIIAKHIWELKVNGTPADTAAIVARRIAESLESAGYPILKREEADRERIDGYYEGYNDGYRDALERAAEYE